ncbi:hypothetical protein K435DRAFT_743329 [Dendrothele bispora CBS 962.96]|uniref:Mediator complex subunit 1 n=1 Tax=Dendrothele bispora (strain CBS 962.96) TaxID=1314807 RepID=A0A4S8MU86_DENBC|nr:hypothetical protein K435DRAFT_743329 [Dendrothele bispora CBS 962.96]
MSLSQTPETLLSTVQNLKCHDRLAAHVTHPFASSAETSCNALQDVIQSTDQVANALNQYLGTNFANTKLVSLLRQQAALFHDLHLSDQNIQQTIDALRKCSGTNYGENIPPDRNALVEWCTSRFQTWGSLVGMETFQEDRAGGINFVFGGKVIVIDVDLLFDRNDPLNPSVSVSNVKTSYAIPPEPNSSNNGSVSLDAFLKDSFQNYLTKVQLPEELRNPLETARLASIIVENLRYLVMLDKLAEQKEDGGVRWFVDIDDLCNVVEGFSKREAQVISSSLSLQCAPLDIFLLRAHTLPLPYLTSPSLSFLTHISPLAYLSLLHYESNSSQLDTNSRPPMFDVPLSRLRQFISSCPKGVTIATLTLSKPMETHLFPASMSMPTLTTRPMFPLVPEGSGLEHAFPSLADIAPVTLDPSSEHPGRHFWMLDFTHSGKFPGVVMSQSKMREIELVINPLSSMETLNPVGMMSYGTGSWVDLLLNPSNHVSSERYTAVYTSPTGAHPPLKLHLTSPEEPGFVLQKVPVHSMREVWGVLEVVREQCWLNETLSACKWSTEGLKFGVNESQGDEGATEEELEAVLSGTMVPRKIPVNVTMPLHHSIPESLFEAPGLDTMSVNRCRPRIVMTSPERPPISGLVEIAVTYDERRPRGLSVDINGAMGVDFTADALEEICRRGGTLGLSGRVWAKAHSLTV